MTSYNWADAAHSAVRIQNGDGSIEWAGADDSNPKYAAIIADGVTIGDPVPIPSSVPPIISDRQFFQQLAIDDEITQDEAIAAVATGTLPQNLAGLVAGLPVDQQFGANMLLKGATQFDRNHPMVDVLGSAFGWDSEQMDALWTAAARL